MPTTLNQVFRTASLARQGNTVSVVRGTTYDYANSSRTWLTTGSITPNTSVGTTTGWSQYIPKGWGTSSTSTAAVYLSTPITTQTNNITLMFRFKLNGSSPNGILWYVGDASFRGFGVVLSTGGTPNIIVGLAGGVDGLATATTASVGTWYHVALRINSSNLWEMFVNGVKDATTKTISANALSGSDPTSFMGVTSAGGGVNGCMTDVVLIKTALTDAEIQAYANAPFI